MVYMETPPAPELASLVESFWTIRSRGPLAAAVLHRVVPDNCNDIIFDFRDPTPRTWNPAARLRSYAVGAMRRPLLVRFAGTVDLIGVRFRPGCGPAFLGVPANELTDAIVPLADLWGQTGRDAESIIAEADAVDRVRAFEELLSHCRPASLEGDRAVAHALQRIEESCGQVRIRDLHEALGLSRRQLERLFAANVGVSPKMACRVTRFRRAQRHLLDRPGASLSRTAFACGYADQPHFTREFAELAGLSPDVYRRQHADVASIQDGPEVQR